MQQSQNIMVKDNKLVVDKGDKPDQSEGGPKLQIFTCNMSHAKYPAPPATWAMNNKRIPDPARLVGQLGTQDHRSCLAVKDDDTVAMEECATTDGDQLASQLMFFLENYVVHGYNSSSLKADASLKGNALNSMKSISGKTEFGCLKLDAEPLNSSKQNGSRGTVDQPMRLVLIATLAAVVVAWNVV